MMISTRGRYALRVMIDLAENAGDGFIPMKEAAARQGISLKYLEQIMPSLSKNGLVEGIHGKGGGYRLSRSPQDYTVGEILRLTDGDLAPVACLQCCLLYTSLEGLFAMQKNSPLGRKHKNIFKYNNGAGFIKSHPNY